MHGPINVKSLNNISKWQMGFNSVFKGLMRHYFLRGFGMIVIQLDLVYMLFILCLKPSFEMLQCFPEPCCELCMGMFVIASGYYCEEAVYDVKISF
jgi:hypothetical protein